MNKMQEHLEKHGLPETVILHKDSHELKRVFESVGVKVFFKIDGDDCKNIIFMGQHEFERRKKDVIEIMDFIDTFDFTITNEVD